MLACDICNIRVLCTGFDVRHNTSLTPNRMQTVSMSLLGVGSYRCISYHKLFEAAIYNIIQQLLGNFHQL